MDFKLIILVLGILSIILQFLAAYFGYQIYKFNRMSKAWLLIIIAFLIQGVRRVITSYEDLSLISITNKVLIDRSLMFLISFFMAIGLLAMMNRFENFEVIDKETKKKVRSFK
jgi:hypothetical protein